jgi:hypothetical protein
MTFTYDPANLTTPLAQVRLEVGDTDTTASIFTDEEINLKLTARADNILLAAADLCDILATRAAGDYDFKWQGAGLSARGEYSRSQVSKQYAERATALRVRAATPSYSFPDTCPLVF